jgi:protein-S-isoprenylcysteine O-methyltransferase Ste14
MSLLVYLSYFFFISEFVLMLSKRTKKSNTSKRGDKGSLLILWLSVMIPLTAGFFIINFGFGNFTGIFYYYAGIIIFAAGMIIRWIAILQLKKSFTVDVSVNKEQLLKTDGLYKRIRHPSYLGLILILAGLSVSMCNYITFLVIVIPIFFAVLYRISVEEKLLSEEFGEKYKNYKKTTKKIIPGIY